MCRNQTLYGLPQTHIVLTRISTSHIYTRRGGHKCNLGSKKTRGEETLHTVGAVRGGTKNEMKFWFFNIMGIFGIAPALVLAVASSKESEEPYQTL